MPSTRPTFRSVPDMLLARVGETPERTAFQYPTSSGWATLRWGEVGARVRAIASGLRALGLAGEERVGLLSSTRLEWILADLGVLCAAGATTTVYPSSTPDETAYILADSGAAYVFAENPAQVDKLAAQRGALGAVRHVIAFEPPADRRDGWVLSLEELEARGRAYDQEHPGEYEATARGVEPGALATLIYTSGTTGRPKGVELTHDCWVYEAEAVDKLGLLSIDDVQYLWLPLAHSFGKVLEVLQLRIGFATTVDGRVDKIVDNLAVVRPTFVCAVPRIFEKVHARVVTSGTEGGGLKARIFRWAEAVGARAVAHKTAGRALPPLLAAQYAVADRLVFGKLRARFGGRLRFFISGSAPLSPEIARFFYAAGVLILEGYGLTETSAASCVNLPARFRFGTVGPALPGTEVMVAPSDGEVLLRGRGVMRGYHHRDEETRAALDADGWLHTGDIGELDADGFLHITDRKKDLIKTSGGKYVAPQELEGRFKALCPLASNVLVHGNNRNYCTALIALDEEALRRWAREAGLAADLSYADLVARDEVRREVERYVDEWNTTLARYETIKKFALVPRDFTIEDGELTASLKLRRKAIEQRYKGTLDGMYE